MKIVLEIVHVKETQEQIDGDELGRVLINAPMSVFGGEAEILCSTRALPPKVDMSLGHESHHNSRSKNVILFRYLGVVFGTGEEP